MKWVHIHTHTVNYNTPPAAVINYENRKKKKKKVTYIPSRFPKFGARAPVKFNMLRGECFPIWLVQGLTYIGWWLWRDTHVFSVNGCFAVTTHTGALYAYVLLKGDSSDSWLNPLWVEKSCNESVNYLSSATVSNMAVVRRSVRRLLLKEVRQCSYFSHYRLNS